ncbi:MAG: preprotein translocase subunit SecG [Bdellovibrionota bacterium]
MMTFLSILQVLACVILVAAVLFQPSKGDGAFSPAAQTSVSNSAGTNFLFKTTMFCAAFLAASSLYMTWVKISDAKSSVIDLAQPMNPGVAPAAPAPLSTPVTSGAPVETAVPATHAK